MFGGFVIEIGCGFMVELGCFCILLFVVGFFGFCIGNDYFVDCVGLALVEGFLFWVFVVVGRGFVFWGLFEL